MEFLLGYTLFGSVVGFYIALISLIIIGIVSDLSDSGSTAFVAFLCFVGLNYFWGNVSLWEIFTFANIGIYIATGFVFSMIRTYFKGRELTDDQRKSYDLKSSVARWWFLFPISLLNWVFGKILVDAYDFIYEKTSKFFEYLFNSSTPKKLIK